MKEKTTDTTQIQRIIMDYYEQLYINKLDDLKERFSRNLKPIKTES